MDVLAVVGLAGTGKSTAVELLHELTGWPVVYFGGVVMQEVARRGLEATEANERQVREEMRRRDGAIAIAKGGADDIDAALARFGKVIIDGLYSHAEYDFLQSRYERGVRTLAVHARRGIREERLGRRPMRPLSPEQMRSRDMSEIATLDKAVPITLADFHIVNDSSPSAFRQRLIDFLGVQDGNRDEIGADTSILSGLSADPEARRRLASFLAREPSWLKTIVDGRSPEQFEHDPWREREVIVDAIGEARHHEGLDLLERCLRRDPNREVALWAALSLAKLGGPAVATVEQLLETADLEQPRRGYLLDALGKIGTQEAVAIAERVLSQDGMSSQRVIFEQALTSGWRARAAS